ncbi:hypothetical protein NZL82_05830 [Sphingomonas sanguinis]|jgi:predicted membrane metal-binding protein|uniref:hypothetical protein n=1 Tax=Sphingomonas sp. LC-1 TaxID=3110957 RepID=UPI0021BB4BA0|nr:hypothetical protein [Sphingomonas sp. LC-1]MCT8001396.1 hypothetical protein [Sphingomonas sp. LC-1]
MTSAFIMYAVAGILAGIGIGLLLALRRPQEPARIYVYRMAGIMALAAAIVLGFSATALRQWSMGT